MAVLIHKGVSIKEGHFCAVTKHKDEKSWVRYDDDIKHNLKWSMVGSQEAYMLFYEKVKTKELT